jgi:MFS family permease
MSGFKKVLAASVGGGLEMYDFVIYLYFSPYIARCFFPHDSHTNALMSVYLVFAVGYFARPIGGVLLAHIGDTLGRKSALVLSLITMGVATLGMSLLPSFEQIGSWACWGIIALRLLQGLSVGGDLPGAITFVAEQAPVESRGWQCACIYTGVNLGVLCAALVSFALSAFTSSAYVAAYGWRIAFALGFVIVLVGLIIRYHVSEGELFQSLKQQNRVVKIPLAAVFSAGNIKPLFQGVALLCLSSVVVTQCFLLMPSFLQTAAHRSEYSALCLNSLSVAFFSCTVLLGGILADRWGRKKTLVLALCGFVIFMYPLYDFFLSSNIFIVAVGLFALALLAGIYIGGLITVLAELYTSRVRFSSIAVVYGLSFAVCGGVTPYVFTRILAISVHPQVVSFLIVAPAVVALCAALSLPPGRVERFR